MSDEKEASRSRFAQLFRQADTDGDGVINGRDAAEFFRKLRLPDGFLKKVCVLSDVKRKGALCQPEFYTALQLIFLCRLDFASSSDESYIQEWKEVLHLLMMHGVIFPVPPTREKMIKIYEDHVTKHDVVTGGHVRAIFGRSSLRQDLFKSLCDLFAMTEHKLVDDDLFVRFGTAVQLLLHATAAARKSRSGRSTPRTGEQSSGRRTPGGSSTPRVGWSKPTSTPRGEVTPAPAPEVSNGANGGHAAVPQPDAQEEARKSAELQIEQADTEVAQARAELLAAGHAKAALEAQTAELNSLVDLKKEEYDKLMAESARVKEATEELQSEFSENQELYQAVVTGLEEAQVALVKDRATHGHLLNAALAQAHVAIRERDVEIAGLKQQLVGSSSMDITPRSTVAIAKAEQEISQVEQALDSQWPDPFQQPQQPTQGPAHPQADPFEPHPHPHAHAHTHAHPQQADPFHPDFVSIPVLEEQRTGGSIISGSFNRTAPLLNLRPRDTDELSDTGTIDTAFTGVSTEYYGETPRPEFLSEAAMAQLGSSITVGIQTISMKGIRRLNRPYVSVCVVDADGRMLTTEQATSTMTVSLANQPDAFLVDQSFVVPIPDDPALASSCALIFKLRQLQKRTGQPNSRCWVPLELRDIIHVQGTQSVTLSLYQKPTDLKRRRMHPEGKQSKLVLKVTAPDIFAESSDPGSHTFNPDQDELEGFTPTNTQQAAEAENSHREPTAEELERAIELFNEKPKKGLQYMTDNGFIRAPPDNLDDIVKFLMKSQGMSKGQIGQYLGTRGELPEAVLKHFVASLEFKGAKFDDCVRMYFREFFPPGEADPIYRMMEIFGARFAEVNPGLFQSEDAPLVLAYAVLMLNTDIHNKAITNKITEAQFVNNLRGCDNRQDIDRGFLADIYRRITVNEIKMKDDDDYRGGRPAGRSWRPSIIKLLTEGGEFLKYGRAGSPHNRWVYLSPDLSHVCYASKFGKASEEQKIPVNQMTRVIKGMNTPVFNRQVDQDDKNKLESQCFSLEATNRTLDLQCNGELECKKFYDAFRFLVAGYLTD
eukprot:TRINITY_DN2014_c0_g1_i6.p1 TRINITY_DN2014_c0_g1~~TRINITY_DN2014_c0_g1_i6.p1  ORF type:complete len:1053 (+),score=283.33 TRINITY_DN2014_c0_g1_i6:152-3310(+)